MHVSFAEEPAGTLAGVRRHLGDAESDEISRTTSLQAVGRSLGAGWKAAKAVAREVTAPAPTGGFSFQPGGGGGAGFSINRVVNAALRAKRRVKHIVPIFSTAASYDEYARTCPIDLRELGLLELPFEKWPEAAPLHAAAAAVAVSNLLARLPVTHVAVSGRRRGGPLRMTPSAWVAVKRAPADNLPLEEGEEVERMSPEGGGRRAGSRRAGAGETNQGAMLTIATGVTAAAAAVGAAGYAAVREITNV